MKMQELFEEREYWSDYPNTVMSKRFATGLKNELAEKFKISPTRIAVKQFLPQIDHYRQRWSIKLKKEQADNADFIKSLVIKFLLSDLKGHFDSAELYDSWVTADRSKVEIFLDLVKRSGR